MELDFLYKFYQILILISGLLLMANIILLTALPQANINKRRIPILKYNVIIFTSLSLIQIICYMIL